MTQSKILVDQAELARFIRGALVAKGARVEDAAVVADGLVWANLRGVDGHGVSRLPFYLRMIDRGDIDVKTKPQLMHDRAATFVVDGGRGFGPVAMMQAIAIAAERAKPGFALVWCATRRTPAQSAAMCNGWRNVAVPG
jgi:ureidoglycolate dehydrogenase (NAD+)